MSPIHLNERRGANPWRVLTGVYAKLVALIIQQGISLIGGPTRIAAWS